MKEKRFRADNEDYTAAELDRYERDALYADYLVELDVLDTNYYVKRAALDDAYDAKRDSLYADYLAERNALDTNYYAKRDALYGAYDAERDALYGAYLAKNAEFERRMADYDVDDPHYADIADAVSDRLHNEFPHF